MQALIQPRAPSRHRSTPTLLAAGLLLAISLTSTLATSAQPKDKDKKLYCWDDGGRRVCSDTLPASAVGHQRTEFDQKTGTAVNRVARELTAEERIRAQEEEEANKLQAQRSRQEMAMVASYDTEEDLQRAFNDRFDLVEESLKGSALALTNLHGSLINLLRQANELELQSKPVGKVLRNKILTQHAELQALRTLQQRQLAERATLDSEFKDVMARYRALKEAQNGGTTAQPSSTPGAASG